MIFKKGTKHCLSRLIRQATDNDFQHLLSIVRTLDFAHGNDVLLARLVPPETLPLNALRLYQKNELANGENNRCLGAIPGPTVSYVSKDFPQNSPSASSTIDRGNTRLTQYLNVRIGCPVMITHNIDVPNGWSNSALATIASCPDRNNIEVIHTATGERRFIQRVTDHITGTAYSRTHFPINLVYASTTEVPR